MTIFGRDVNSNLSEVRAHLRVCVRGVEVVGGGGLWLFQPRPCDVSQVRKTLGVCPQHDVLWPDLTVREHLELYAAVKGVPRHCVKAEVAKSLKEVGEVILPSCTLTCRGSNKYLSAWSNRLSRRSA